MKKLWLGNLVISVTCFIFIIFILSPVKTFAFDFDESEAENVIDSYKNYEIINENQSYERVDDFSINEIGNIAVATNSYVNFYNNNGEFLYGINIPTLSGAFAIEYTGIMLEIYEVRTNRFVVLNSENAKIMKAIKIQKNKYNYAEIKKIEESFRPAYKKTTEYTYFLNATLSEVSRMGSDGEKLIIYHMNDDANFLDFLSAIMIFFIAVVIIEYKMVSKIKTEHLQSKK